MKFISSYEKRKPNLISWISLKLNQRQRLHEITTAAMKKGNQTSSAGSA
jgi:hypothetical protein